MALGNPIEAYLEAQQMQNQNQRNMYGDIAGIGQGLGQAIAGFGGAGSSDEERKRKIVKQLLLAMQQPQQLPMQGPMQDIPSGPPIQGPSGYLPPSGGSDMIPAGQSPMQQPQRPMMQNPAADITGPMMQLFPEQMAKSLIPMNDLQKSEIFKNYATGTRKMAPAAQLTTIYRNPQDGSVSDTPQEGWTAFQVKPGQALQTLTNVPLAKERADAQRGKTEAWNRSIDAKQIDSLAKTTGLHPTVVRQLQTNNLRADRALAILDDPKATWSALNGWVSTDFAGIMQGGAPQKEQVLESQFPNWRAKLSQIRTYVGSEPKGSIPDGFREYMRHFVSGIKEIDNDYLKKNADFQQSMIAPTIRGGSPYVQKSQDFMKDFIKGPTKSTGTIKVKNFTVTP